MTLSITKFAAACLVTLGLASASYAQNNDADIIRPITASGSAAFLFSLNGLGDFGFGGPIVGGSALSDKQIASGETVSNTGGNTMMPGVGAKFFVSDNTALRVALAFRLYEDGKEEIGNSSVSGGQGPGKVQRNTTGINFGGEYHFRPLYSTSPYLGALISFVTDNFKSTYRPSTGDPLIKNLKSTSFGVGAVVGFNWFFTRGLALGGEYGLGFTSTSSVFEFPGQTKADEPTNTDVGMGVNGGGSLQFIVYF
jgi:hypothetical protein